VPSPRPELDAKPRVHATAIHERSRGRYGVPRGRAELRAAGFRVSGKRVARIVTELGLASRRNGQLQGTTDSNQRQGAGAPLPSGPKARGKGGTGWRSPLPFAPKAGQTPSPVASTPEGAEKKNTTY